MTTPTMGLGRPSDVDESDHEREIARKRVESKRKYRSDLVAYVIVNAFLVAAWALSGGGYFWPGWVLAGWAVLLLIDGYRVYMIAPITEADVDEELRRRR